MFRLEESGIDFSFTHIVNVFEAEEEKKHE
jgi:hypothetical protein